MYVGDDWYGFDDAIYASARVLSIVARASGPTDGGVRALLADVPAYPSSPEIRVPCADEVKFDIVARAVAHFKVSNDVIVVDGARVEYGDGWGLIRASNTDAALFLRFEARTPERLQSIMGEMTGWLGTQGVRR